MSLWSLAISPTSLVAVYKSPMSVLSVFDWSVTFLIFAVFVDTSVLSVDSSLISFVAV